MQLFEIKRIHANKIFPLVSEILEQGQRVRITVTGMSMYPFLREDIDSVELTKTDWNNVKCGDIVLTLRDNGMYILHRILRKEKDTFYIVGDAQQWIEGPLLAEQLIAKVNSVWRKDKRIYCSNLIWRLLVFIWRLLLPFRYKIINGYKLFHRILIGKFITQ